MWKLVAASQSVPGKRRVGESLSPGAMSAREHHSPDSGRETEGSQAWSLFHPKCVKCRARHQAQKNGSSVSGVGVPVSGVRREQGGAQEGCSWPEGRGSGKRTGTRVLGTGRKVQGVCEGKGPSHVGGEKRVGEWADRGGLGGLVPMLMDSWAGTGMREGGRAWTLVESVRLMSPVDGSGGGWMGRRLVR